MGPDLIRLENEAMAAVERYREGCRRALTRKISELPPHGFAELVITLLERVGLTQIRAVRRPGAAAGEAHFTALSRTPAGEVRVAVIVRKDGREIGRERVIEARGALHHYGPAWGAWLVTSGHALSGAREEATAPGGVPVNILDGNGVAKLCEEHGLGVVRTSVPICIPDSELFDGLRGG
jgi:restriction endonuclease Mrr